jgi:hypothetical protein
MKIVRLIKMCLNETYNRVSKGICETIFPIPSVLKEEEEALTP